MYPAVWNKTSQSKQKKNVHVAGTGGGKIIKTNK
jgi:hypothetical protein